MEVTAWLEAFSGEFTRAAAQVAAYLPRLLLAVFIMLAGWLLARLVRAISIRMLLGLDFLWQRVIARLGLERLEPRFPPTRIAGEILFWLVVLLAMAGVAAVLGLEIFVTWISALTTYIPILLTGLLIILAGIIISTMLRDLVASAVERTGAGRGELLGRIVQITVLITATAIGVEQVGIDITFLSVIVGIGLASTLGGMALAFGLGARAYMSNVIAGHHIRQTYRTGDRLRLRGYEGTIIEVTPTRVIISTDSGRVVIPAGVFEEEITELREQHDSEG